MNLEFLSEFLNTIYMPLLFLVALMFGDFIFGVIVALVQKRFSWDILPKFLVTDGVWIFAWLFADFIIYFFKDIMPATLLTTLSTGFFLPVAGKIAASLLGHFSALGLLTKGLEKINIGATGLDDRENGNG